MGWRGTLALVAVVAIVGVLLWLEGPPKPEVSENPPNLLGEPKLRDPSKFVPLIAFEPSTVVKISVRQGDNELTAERDGDGWKSSRPTPALDVFLTNLSELGRIIEIPESPEALMEYGLDDPKSVVELSTRDGKEPRVLELGHQNPAATGVYTRIDRQGAIVLAGALAIWEVDKLFRVAPGQAG